MKTNPSYFRPPTARRFSREAATAGKFKVCCGMPRTLAVFSRQVDGRLAVGVMCLPGKGGQTTLTAGTESHFSQSPPESAYA